MAVIISGNGIDMGNNPVSNVSIATSADVVDKAYVSRVMVSGGRDVYLGSYGLEWNETTDTYRRIGAENYTAIQSLMKRCCP